jgi:3',5'-cyclic AMP phosphodiesterase CpdA
MSREMDRRTFLRIAGTSLGVGALYRVAPTWAKDGPSADVAQSQLAKNGEAVTPFTFVQMSDTHVGFAAGPNPTGTKAFERAVEVVNRLPVQPELILFTGDLSHESEVPGEHAARMERFREIASRLRTPVRKMVPGEHDAALDGGALYRNRFGDTHYSFDHRGVHFIALDNVSRPKPEVGAEQLAWLRQDLARFPKTAPVVVFTHRPLFDLKPEWEWFTRDGDLVMAALAPYENVTVLYGHIHREDLHKEGHSVHYAARSLIFAFPDPAQVMDKKPNPFDKEHPFKNLGVRVVASQGEPRTTPLRCEEVELSMREYSRTEGFAQLLKPSSL